VAAESEVQLEALPDSVAEGGSVVPPLVLGRQVDSSPEKSSPPPRLPKRKPTIEELAGSSDEHAEEAGNDLVPRWQIWPGNNRFFFEGRFMTGPEPSMLICTSSLLVVPVIVFIVLVLPSMGDRGAPSWLPVPVPVLALPAGLLLVFSMVCLFRASFTEPGILPRKDPKRGFAGQGVKPQRQDQIINGVKVSLKWCSTCEIYRPPRSKHCAFCNNCVIKFDHHCPWVSNCVGGRNYKFFFCFVFSTFVLALYVFSVLVVIAIHVGFFKGLFDPYIFTRAATYPALLVLLVFIGCLLFPLGNLMAFHCYLITKNMTTNEEITGVYPGKNPFSLGYTRNWKQFLQQFQEPTLVEPGVLVPAPGRKESITGDVPHDAQV